MQQMTMIHMAEDKACYMASSVHETPTPAVLKEALETVSEISYALTLALLPSALKFFWRV